MINGVKIFAGALLLIIFLVGCGHAGKVHVDSKGHGDIKYGNTPKISQLNDGTFIYVDKKYDGVDDIRFGF